MVLEQQGNALTALAFFLANKVGKTGLLDVTVDVWKIVDTTTKTEIVTGAAATEIGDGCYGYTLASGSVDAEGLYLFVFKTADADVEQQHIAALWSVQKGGIENLDAAMSSRLATAGYTAPPSAVAVADQVWDETMADHTSAGTTGQKLDASGGAGDPLTNVVPGAYAAGTAGAALGRVGTAEITVTAPVDTAGNVTIHQGEDRDQVDFDNAAGTWPDLTGATVTIYVRGVGVDFSKALTVVTPTGSQKVRLALTDIEASALRVGRHQHQVWAVLADADQALLVTGQFEVKEDKR